MLSKINYMFVNIVCGKFLLLWITKFWLYFATIKSIYFLSIKKIKCLFSAWLKPTKYLINTQLTAGHLTDINIFFCFYLDNYYNKQKRRCYFLINVYSKISLILIGKRYILQALSLKKIYQVLSRNRVDV